MKIFFLAKNQDSGWRQNERIGILYFKCFSITGIRNARTKQALDQAVKLLKPGGKLMLVGIPTVDRISFPIDDLRRREICIQNVRRQNECMQPALELIESGKVDADSMITHRYRLEETRKAFDLVAGYRDGVIKALIIL